MLQICTNKLYDELDAVLLFISIRAEPIKLCGWSEALTRQRGEAVPFRTTTRSDAIAKSELIAHEATSTRRLIS